MDFETMDWEEEAKRVCAAFSIEVACHIIDDGDPPRKRFLVKNSDRAIVMRNDGWMIAASYGTRGRIFSVTQMYLSHSWYAFTINWNGQATQRRPFSEAIPILAQGLFNLGLLSSHVESVMGTKISAHEKLEWSLEYEERLKKLLNGNQ